MGVRVRARVIKWGSGMPRALEGFEFSSVCTMAGTTYGPIKEH